MSLTFDVDDRLLAAAEQWAEARMTDLDDALETKVEQALLEIEHLVSDAHEVAFEVDGRTVTHEPSEELAALLARQAERTGLDESAVLKLHVDLFADAFQREADAAERPPDAPRPE